MIVYVIENTEGDYWGYNKGGERGVWTSLEEAYVYGDHEDVQQCFETLVDIGQIEASSIVTPVEAFLFELGVDK